MSILETFYILFKSDSKDVKKGAEEAERSTVRLNDSLKNVNRGTENVGRSFVSLTRSLSRVIAAFGAVGTVIGGLKSAYEYTNQLDQASRALNVNISTLDAWGRAVARNGGTVEGFQNSLKGLATHLGISNQSALNMLPELADTFKNGGVEQSATLGKQLGLDESTILLLQQGRREVEAVIARQKELGTVTKQDAEAAKVFNNQWSDMTAAFTNMWATVGTKVLPILGKIVDAFTRAAVYLRHHSDLIVGGLIAVGAAAAFLAAPFILANLAILRTISILVALGTAFALVYEDIQAFRQGNDSLIGDIFKKWPVAGKVIIGTFNLIKESIKGVIESFKYFFDLFDRFNSYVSDKENKIFGKILGFAKDEIGISSDLPINSQTSSSIFNGGSNTNSNRNSSVVTGPITINTQATDGYGVAKHLRDQFRQATGNQDDGVLA